MSQPADTVETFLRVLRASGLVEARRLEDLVKPWQGITGPVPDELVAALTQAGVLTEWQLAQLRKGKHRGFLLGKGGMASVYMAEHTTARHPVAIKVLPNQLAEKKSYLARFEREARAAYRLNHPNIAGAKDVELDTPPRYIALEYVDGIDLHAKVKAEGPLPLRDALDYVRQAALGLQHAHEEGLVHRDIKPANLMLDKRGTVKILDLGLALTADDDEEAGLTKAHDEKVLGTADYLAPEQSKDSHAANPRSDLYSLGCTLYFLLVGRAPFAKGTVVERIKAHWNEPPPNLLDDRPDAGSTIVDLYYRLLEKHPDARPQSASEVAETIGSWLATSEATSTNVLRPAIAVRPAPGSSNSSLPQRETTGGTSKPSGGRRPPSDSDVLGRSPSSRGTTPHPTAGKAAAHPTVLPSDDEDDDFLNAAVTKPGTPSRAVGASADAPDDEDDDDFLSLDKPAGKQRPASPAPLADDDDDDDFLGTGASPARPPAGDDDDDDEDFLTTATRPATATSAPNVRPGQTPEAMLAEDDMAFLDWLRDERLGLPIWGWFGMLFLLFLIALGIAIYLHAAKKAEFSTSAAGHAPPAATTPPPAISPAPSHEPIAPPEQSLLGKWVVQSWRKAGKETVNDKAPPTFKFTQDTLLITLVEPTAEKQGVLDGGRYTAQADATPKSFETQHDGNNGTTTVFWIYEFTDSGLRLCKSTTETKPKEFSDSAGYETITLTRMEPEKDTEESPD
jgi:uncharacterized protein (TIGR03067 family)